MTVKKIFIYVDFSVIYSDVIYCVVLSFVVIYRASRIVNLAAN